MSKSAKSSKSSVNADASAPPKAPSRKPSSAREQVGTTEIQAQSKAKTSKKTAPTSDQPTRKSGTATKLDEVIAMLRTKHGVSIDEIAEAVDWQRHSVRGAISGQLKKKLGLTVLSEKLNGTRLYRIAK